MKNIVIAIYLIRIFKKILIFINQVNSNKNFKYYLISNLELQKF